VSHEAQPINQLVLMSTIGIIYIYILIILQNYTTISKFTSFDNQPSCATAVGPTATAPTGVKAGQPPWPTAVEAYSSCAMVVGPTVVGHDGRGCATTVAYGGRLLIPIKAEN
jgi:hypothetical protein